MNALWRWKKVDENFSQRRWKIYMEFAESSSSVNIFCNMTVSGQFFQTVWENEMLPYPNIDLSINFEKNL